MKIVCVCTAGKTRSVWMAEHINRTFPEVTAEARGINGRLAEDRRISIPDIRSADLILTASSVHASFLRGMVYGLLIGNMRFAERYAMSSRNMEIVNLPLMGLWRTEPDRALDSIDRIIRRRLK